eukprot:761961-Hanusia_phi.AAC.1
MPGTASGGGTEQPLKLSQMRFVDASKLETSSSSRFAGAASASDWTLRRSRNPRVWGKSCQGISADSLRTTPGQQVR